LYEYIKSNINDVKKRIEAAAKKSGRMADDIKLIAVSKNVDIDRIRAAVEYGINDLGENRVQELLSNMIVYQKTYHGI